MLGGVDVVAGPGGSEGVVDGCSDVTVSWIESGSAQWITAADEQSLVTSRISQDAMLI